MVRTKHNIDIHFNLFDKNFNKKMKNVSTSLNSVNKRINEQAHGFSQLNQKQKITKQNTAMNKLAQQGFAKTMRMGQGDFRKFNDQNRRFNTLGGRTANVLRKATHGARGFRMEMLGVMFFGMAMQRVFAGILKTSLSWLGVTEILTTALGIMFLPVAMELLQWALKFLNWVGELNEEQKIWYGKLVLVGFALGTIIMLVGTLALGIGSLILAFGWLFTPMGAVVGVLAAIAGYFGLKYLFLDLGKSVDEAKEKLIGFGISAEFIKKAESKFREVIINLSEDVETWKTVGANIFNNILLGVQQFIKDNPLLLVGLIVGAFAAGPMGAGIGAAIGLALGKMDLEKMDETMEKGMEILDGMIQGIVDNLDQLEEVITQIAQELTQFVIDHFDEFVNIGITIAGAIGQGIANALRNTIDKLLHIKKGSKLEKFLWGPSPPKVESVRDFIIQPGGRMIKTDPMDTIIGRKGGFPSGEINLNVTYNIEVSDKDELERMFDRNNSQLVEEVKRQIAI